MEAAQLDPGTGEWPSVPGTLEDGDPPRGPQTQAGACHSGAGGLKGARPGGEQGPGDPGANEGATERSRDPATGDHEGPSAGSHDAPGHAGATGSYEGSGVTRATGTHQRCRNPGATGTHEGTGDLGATGTHEGTRDHGATGTHEGTRDHGASGTHEGTRYHGATGTHEGSRDLGATRNYEGSGDLRASKRHEGSGDPRATRRHEGSRDGSGASSNEGLPRDGSRKSTNVTGATDQRAAGPSIAERVHEFGPSGTEGAQSSGGEELYALGTSNSTESNDAGANVSKEPADPGPITPEKCPHSEPRKRDGPHDGSMEGPEDARGSESFKKPVSAPRPSWNEKTLEQRAKSPASAQLPPSGGLRGDERQAAQDVSARLPSDAYRASPAIPYREPPWSGRPESLYSLEVLKEGSVLSTKSLDGISYTVFGRLPGCHVSLEHPSVSRYHAVLQYRSVPGTGPEEEPGYYMYDLGSTHGTFINKQRIPAKTYCRFRVGHVVKFGGSTRLFILQGPDEDQEAESDMTVTQIKEARRQRESLQKRMLGDDSDEEDGPSQEKGGREPGEAASGSGCMWGMGEDAEEEENDENPIAMEFHEEREASYLKDPKKALQGFFDREGEELEFEYDERGAGTWLCRVKLPVDDSSGKQLIAEITHSGKKKDAARLCALDACRLLEMRGLLRQEAVARKRKSKRWEDEDFYDSDDDTFLDRTGIVEKKRLNRMKKAGKIGEKAETLESLTTKLEVVEKEIAEIAARLKTTQTGETQNSAQDPLDAFMTEIKAGSTLDSVTRKKLNLQTLELRKEQQRLKALIKIVQPAKLPELKPNQTEQDPKAKKLTLPMFGAMKGGRKFKLKTGTVGTLPPKRTDLPASFFTMKDESIHPEVEEEEEEDDEVEYRMRTDSGAAQTAPAEQSTSEDPGSCVQPPPDPEVEVKKSPNNSSSREHVQTPNNSKRPVTQSEGAPKATAVKQRKMQGPSRPPRGVSTTYPDDDPDYCVWTPPTGQTGDGKTHLNEKYGY